MWRGEEIWRTVADHDGVDEECEQRQLVLCRVFFEERRGVVVAYGDAGWALGIYHRSSRCEKYT